jgi:SSS family solute:Na+ symporter
MIITVSITTVVWLAVTFATQPESNETLVKFYKRARPGIAGWKPIARLAPEVIADRAGAHNFIDWICGCVLIYGVLFGTGKLLLGETGTGLALLALGLAGGAVIYFDVSRRGWNTVTG